MQTFIIFVQKNLSIFSFINSGFVSYLGKPSGIQLKNIFSVIFLKCFKNFSFTSNFPSHLELLLLFLVQDQERFLSVSVCLSFLSFL